MLGLEKWWRWWCGCIRGVIGGGDGGVREEVFVVVMVE